MRRSDVILIVIMLLSAFWRWDDAITSRAFLPDEIPYVNAARHLEAGRSPYAEPYYFYPPPVASFIHHTAPVFGEISALRILRGASLSGLVVGIALALGTVSWPWYARLSTGILFVILAPSVRLATAMGNVAGLATGLVLFGLLAWGRRPILAGAALGIGLAIKPIAPLAPLLLAFHRPLEARHQHWAATASCVAAGLAACLGGLRYLSGFVANADVATNPYNFSLGKVFAEMGIGIPTLLPALLVAAAASLIVRRRAIGEKPLIH